MTPQPHLLKRKEEERLNQEEKNSSAIKGEPIWGKDHSGFSFA